MKKAALLVFAKAPIAGNVKTRLREVLSDEEAASLYRAFLLDALDEFRTLPVDILLFFAESDEIDLSEYAMASDAILRQEGMDLATRMMNAFLESFRRGYERAVIIGTDHPTLPNRFITLALEELGQPLSIVIGPSADGGYYLLGMNDFFPQLFDDMTFSHPRVFEQTMARADRLNADVIVLPEWYDVDTPGALTRLVEDLSQTGGGLLRTRAIIQQLQISDRLG